MDDLSDEKARLLNDSTPFSDVMKRAIPVMGKQDQPEDGLPPEEGMAQLALFRGIEIRQVFHDSRWYFSVIDVCGALADSTNARRYWSDLKRQLHDDEGFDELYEKIVQLKMEGPDGKLYATDAVDAETLLRIVQSIPSKKAGPFKKWLAKVGYERILEIQDPEIAVKRAILSWQAAGRTNDWIDARIRGIVARKDLTDQWQARGIAGKQYGTLTNVVSTETFGIKTDQHALLKGLKPKHNLRDHMTDLELVFTMLGEKSTTAIAQATNAQGFRENVDAASSGGKVAGNARRELERKIGHSLVSRNNFLEGSRTNDTTKLTQKKPAGK